MGRRREASGQYELALLARQTDIAPASPPLKAHAATLTLREKACIRRNVRACRVLSRDKQDFPRGNMPRSVSLLSAKQDLRIRRRHFQRVHFLFPDETLARRLTVEKLFLLRHYSFPSRLLDISENPLVDLFSSALPIRVRKPLLREDGVAYVVPAKEIKFAGSDAVSIPANLCKRPNSEFFIKDILHLGSVQQG
ncbi:MAG: hypothetical protein LBG43_07430 [Treponema sp.]|jgi:hypothetical protein|nr:hypothetical protein [Treponema sp.]